MADFDSSLPVRTENAGDVIAKIADATTPSQQLAVNADGSINITDNGGSITVDGSLTVSATDLDIRDLVFATDKVDVSGSVVALDAPTLAALESITVQNGAGAAAVNIQDGGNSITVDASNLDIRDLVFATDKVDVSGSSVSISGDVNVTQGTSPWVVSATDLDIRDLAFATDKVDVSGSSDLSLSASTLAALESITVQNGAGAAAVNIQDGGNSITVDGTVSISGDVNVTATDLDIRNLSHSQDSIKIGDGTDFLAVNADGSINVVISNDISGSEVCAYNTSAALAAGASVNFDYTVTAAMTMILDQAYMSGSGKIKAELKVETAAGSGTYNTKFVGFNSTANSNIQFEVERYLKQVAGAKVRITITNRDNQPQDVYSTLMGSES